MSVSLQLTRYTSHAMMQALFCTFALIEGVIMSTEFIFRMVGMVLFGILGGLWGFQFGGTDFGESLRYSLIIG
jgi:hypothetical protein